MRTPLSKRERHTYPEQSKLLSPEAPHTYGRPVCRAAAEQSCFPENAGKAVREAAPRSVAAACAGFPDPGAGRESGRGGAGRPAAVRARSARTVVSADFT